jgi:IMP dehydrogenase
MTDESPTRKVSIKNSLFKPYWGEGSNRARNWQRYSEGAASSGLHFEEGIDGYVPIIGSVKAALAVTTEKLRATMCNMGSVSLQEFTKNAILTLVSGQSIVEGGTDNIVQIETELEIDI